MDPVHEPSLAQVLRAALEDKPGSIAPAQWRVLHALLACRTPALGGHQYRCLHCNREHFVPHSCGNRHCPQCQGKAAALWLEQQHATLLPIPYFHVVFTLPHALNPLIRQNRRALYGLLFEAASQTLLAFGQKRFGARIGITAVLHTWGQNLIDHYHLHCVVTGGAWDEDTGRWVGTSPGYLFPVRALAQVFRGKFLAGLKHHFEAGQLEFHGELSALAAPAPFHALVREAASRDWVVYAKRPFAGPEQVLAYLSRYTHRIAISPRRLLALDPQAGTVRFAYKDYAAKGRRKVMTLRVGEFLRRFLLHVLPARFAKIRHYGLLANRGREERIARVRMALSATTNLGPVTSESASAPSCGSEELPGLICPWCGKRGLQLVAVFPRPKRPKVPVIDTS